MNQDKKVGIYLRLSKEDETKGESGSISNQRLILLDYIKKNHLEYVDEYVDDGVSGTTFERTGFQRMMKDIEKKRINMVITKDTSRLGRDHIEFGYYVEKYFPEHGVRYVAVSENIDTESNYNDMLLFKSAYNDMYVKDISNKIRASLNIKKQHGEFVGAYAPYGYTKSKEDKHKLLIDEEAALVVKEIYKLFLRGYSISRIAQTLSKENILIPSIYKNMNHRTKTCFFYEWNTKTISDILTNPTYMGSLTQGRNKKINYKSKKRIHVPKDKWITKENSCPAIIDKITFNMVQELYQKNKYRKKDNSQNKYLLKGLVYCKECNHRIGFRKVSRKNKNGEIIDKYYGNCNNYLKHKSYHVCTPHSISYQELENLVLSNLHQKVSLLDKNKVIARLKDLCQTKNKEEIEKKLNFLKRKLEISKKKMEHLYEDKISELIDKDFYLQMKNKIINETENTQEELTNLKKELTYLKNIPWDNYLTDILNRKKTNLYLIESLIDKITLSEDNNICIYYRIRE